MPWPHTIFATAALLAFGLFFALPPEDAPETALDERASAFCEITPSLIVEPLGKAGPATEKDFRTRITQSESSLAGRRNLIENHPPSRSPLALNRLLRC